MTGILLLQELEGCMVLCNGKPVGDAETLDVADPVDSKVQVAAGGLCQDDLLVGCCCCQPFLQQRMLLHKQPQKFMYENAVVACST